MFWPVMIFLGGLAIVGISWMVSKSAPDEKTADEMSDSELLRKIAKHSEESARHVLFIRICITVIAIFVVAGFTITYT